MNRLIAILASSTFVLSACSTIRMRYDAKVIGKGGSSTPFFLEKSYPIDNSTKIWCWATGIFYGGWCWSYLFMPTDKQKSVLDADVQQYLNSSKGVGTYTLFDVRSKSVGWHNAELVTGEDTPSGPIQVVEQEAKSDSTDFMQEATEKIIDTQFRRLRLYAGGDLIGAKPGDPLVFKDFKIDMIGETFTSSTLSFDQEAKIYSVKLQVSFKKTSSGSLELESSKISQLDEVRTTTYAFTENAIYRKDPIAKYRSNKRIVNAVRGGSVYIGMPADAAFVSLGTPAQTNVTRTPNRRHEQWVYSNNFYVYIDGGAVTSWQQSK